MSIVVGHVVLFSVFPVLLYLYSLPSFPPLFVLDKLGELLLAVFFSSSISHPLVSHTPLVVPHSIFWSSRYIHRDSDTVSRL